MKLYKTNKENSRYNANLNLTEIANQLGLDKGNINPKLTQWHKTYPQHITMGYTNTYERYMRQCSELPINILQIGVCDKRFPYGSLKMWQTYFNSANIYGADNYFGNTLEEHLQQIQQLNESGINFVYADQGSFSDWKLILKQLPQMDFIIQDGSHWPNHMMVSLYYGSKLLKPGGYYFMQDIQNPLKSRGWFKLDNALIAQQLLKTRNDSLWYSSFLNDQQNKFLSQNVELVQLILDPNEICYLAVFKKL